MKIAGYLKINYKIWDVEFVSGRLDGYGAFMSGKIRGMR